MRTLHPNSMKWMWFVAASIVAFLAGLIFVYRTFVTPPQLSTYFSRLQPEMSYSEITQFLPRAMISADKRSSTSMLWQTVRVHSNAMPASEIRCSYHEVPFGGAEIGIIYFDDQDRLVGAWYSSSGGGRWTPRWGARYE